MNKTTATKIVKKQAAADKPKVEKSESAAYKHVKEIKFQESPYERALKISSEEVIALAIRDMLTKDCLN